MTFSNPPVPRTLEDQLVSIRHDDRPLNRESVTVTNDLTGAGPRA